MTLKSTLARRSLPPGRLASARPQLTLATEDAR